MFRAYMQKFIFVNSSYTRIWKVAYVEYEGFNTFWFLVNAVPL